MTPFFDTPPTLSGMPAAKPRLAGKTSPGGVSSRGLLRNFDMPLKSMERVDHALREIAYLSQKEKLALAEILLRDAQVSRRSDGSIITPYAPDGGPLGRMKGNGTTRHSDVGFIDPKAAKKRARENAQKRLQGAQHD